MIQAAAATTLIAYVKDLIHATSAPMRGLVPVASSMDVVAHAGLFTAHRALVCCDGITRRSSAALVLHGLHSRDRAEYVRRTLVQVVHSASNAFCGLLRRSRWGQCQWCTIHWDASGDALRGAYDRTPWRTAAEREQDEWGGVGLEAPAATPSWCSVRPVR
jgi:hypothetical protein